MFPDTPAHRYMRDPAFKVLVDMLEEAMNLHEDFEERSRYIAGACQLAECHRMAMRVSVIYVDPAGDGSFVL